MAAFGKRRPFVKMPATGETASSRVSDKPMSKGMVRMTKGTLLLSTVLAFVAQSAGASSIVSLGSADPATAPSIVVLGEAQPATPVADTESAADPMETAALPASGDNSSIATMGAPAVNANPRDEEQPAAIKSTALPLVLRGNFGDSGDSTGSSVAISAPETPKASGASSRTTYGEVPATSGSSGASTQPPAEAQPSPAQLDR